MNDTKIHIDGKGNTEYFAFLNARFNITAAFALINKNPDKFLYNALGEKNVIDLDAFSRWFSPDKIETSPDGLTKITTGISINVEHADAISDERLMEPGVVVNINNEMIMLIDGWHRAYRLHKGGIKKMAVYVISDIKDLKKVCMFPVAKVIRNLNKTKG